MRFHQQPWRLTLPESKGFLGKGPKLLKGDPLAAILAESAVFHRLVPSAPARGPGYRAIRRPRLPVIPTPVARRQINYNFVCFYLEIF